MVDVLSEFRLGYFSLVLTFVVLHQGSTGPVFRVDPATQHGELSSGNTQDECWADVVGSF